MSGKTIGLYSCPNSGLEGVLWDYDGTAVDSLPVIFPFWKRLCDEAGKKFPFEDYDDLRRKFREPFPTEFYEKLLGFNWEKDKKWIIAKYRKFKKAHRSPLREGIIDVWKYVKDLGLKNGIVSSSLSKSIKAELKGFGVKCGPGGLIEVVVGYDSGLSPKPAPDNIVEGSRLLGISPPSGLYVGDMPSDVVASRAAGMPCAVLPGGYATAEALKAENPAFFAENLNKIKPFIKGLVEGAQCIYT